MSFVEKPKIIVIVGPTASGKSDLALFLAQKLNGEIISADSRQVYRGMDIGTGKVTKKERRLVPHHLLDVADPKRTFTVSQYQRLARRAVKDILHRGKIPIIVGGTGLYIDALVYDLPIPSVRPNKKLRAKLEKQSAEHLFKRLKKLDPARAKTTDRYNKRRLIRALEIIAATGKPVLPLSTDYQLLVTNYDPLWIGITWPSSILAKRIKKRLDARLKQGMLAEVKNLRKSGVSWKKLESFGLEYKWLALYLQGKVSQDDMRENLYRAIVRYSKRQSTWFKRNKKVRWVTGPIDAQRHLSYWLRSTTA